jgi:hypothetical protein
MLADAEVINILVRKVFGCMLHDVLLKAQKLMQSRWAVACRSEPMLRIDEEHKSHDSQS